MKISCMILLLVCTFLQGCAHQLTLDNVECLQLGVSKNEIEQQFGKPTDIFETEVDRNSIEWFYVVGDYNKAVFEIDRTIGQLFSKFWNTKDDEAGQKLDIVLSRYPNSHFKFRDSKIKSPHGGLGYAWYDDNLSGVSVQIRKERNTVEAIVWCKELPMRSCRKE